MKVDIVSQEDKAFMDYFKNFEIENKVFKFKRTKNAGAMKSQIQEVQKYIKQQTKTKKSFSFNFLGKKFHQIYSPKTGNYTLFSSTQMTKRDKRIWLGNS